MTLFTISSELLILWWPNLVWSYVIKSQSVLWKKWITAFKVEVTANVQKVSKCLSRAYRLNCCMFCNQTWYDDALSWARVSCKRIGLLCLFMKLGFSPDIIHSGWLGSKHPLTVLKVKVTARAYLIKKWHFLWFFFNHWSFCYQTWFCGTLS